MNTLKNIGFVISASLTLSACTYSPNNAKTVNNYYGGTTPDTLTPHALPATDEMQSISRIATIQELEKLNREFDDAIAQLK
jgi:hypothetical protein